MSTKKAQWIRIGMAAAVIGLAMVRLAFHDGLYRRMDSIFFIVMGTGLLLLLVPLQYLKSFKAGSLEFSLEQPQIQGAISGLNVDRIKNEKIQAHLLRLKDQLGAIRGSRVLWIDDHPHGVVGERRLLRALGVEVVTAVSSDAAFAILEADNDFDLIITDVQRVGTSHQVTGGVPIHEGTNFIVALRKNHPDPVINRLPVVFYAAYDWQRLVDFTNNARAHYPSPEISNSEEDLIPKVIRLLAESRATPIRGTKDKKKPSPARGHGYYSYPRDSAADLPPYDPSYTPEMTSPDSGPQYYSYPKSDPAPYSPAYPSPPPETYPDTRSSTDSGAQYSYPKADPPQDLPAYPLSYAPESSSALNEDTGSGKEKKEHFEEGEHPAQPEKER